MNIKPNFNFKNYKTTAAAALFAMAAVAAPCSAQIKKTLAPLNYDKVTLNIKLPKVTPQGTNDINILQLAPSPKVTINNKPKNALFVVDLSTNILYHYNEKGEPIYAYKIASGKKSTPTHKGVRIVSHIETYPYKYAPSNSKRRKNPKDYGPKIIILNQLDPKTGEQSPIGEFIHGNRNAATLGKYVSHGCMRMDNEVIKHLSQIAKQGDIVLIQ